MKIKRGNRKITLEVYNQVKDFIKLGMKREAICKLFEPCVGNQTFGFIKQSTSLDEFHNLQQVANLRSVSKKKSNEVTMVSNIGSINEEKIISADIPQPTYTNTLDNTEIIELLKTQNKILIELNNAVTDLNGMIFRLTSGVEPSMANKVKSLFRVL